jgi:DtxR family transcriptional regulator, Mn-dependent transcriptional regulator
VPSEFHPPVEEYLKTVEYLNEEGTPVIQARLAERMGKSPPAVSEMLDRLRTDGYLQTTRTQIALTAKGRCIAESVIRKHRLAECFLVDVIGLPWYRVHEEAGLWEHVMSDEVASRLDDLLHHPRVCPHGNPIGPKNPEGESPIVSLAGVSTGAAVRLERLTEEIELDTATLRYLDDSGFAPGCRAVVTLKAPDGTLVLNTPTSMLALGAEVCRRLFVSVENGA